MATTKGETPKPTTEDTVVEPKGEGESQPPVYDLGQVPEVVEISVGGASKPDTPTGTPAIVAKINLATGVGRFTTKPSGEAPKRHNVSLGEINREAIAHILAKGFGTLVQNALIPFATKGQKGWQHTKPEAIETVLTQVWTNAATRRATGDSVEIAALRALYKASGAKVVDLLDAWKRDTADTVEPELLAERKAAYVKAVAKEIARREETAKQGATLGLSALRL